MSDFFHIRYIYFYILHNNISIINTHPQIYHDLNISLIMVTPTISKLSKPNMYYARHGN